MTLDVGFWSRETLRILCYSIFYEDHIVSTIVQYDGGVKAHCYAINVYDTRYDIHGDAYSRAVIYSYYVVW